MENIRYGKLDATDEEVYAAARLANADTFIRQLPDGWTVITEDGLPAAHYENMILITRGEPEILTVGDEEL